jgi:hypothetical protein
MTGNGSENNLQRIAKALDEKGVSLKCPCCAGEEWARNPEPVVLPIPSAQTDPGTKAGLPAYALICYQCGFLKMHSTKFLLGEAGKPTSP